TEMVLTAKRRLAPSSRERRRLNFRAGSKQMRGQVGSGSSSRAAVGAIQIGRTVSAAITNRRALGPAEARIMGSAGLLLLAGAVLWPRVISVPLAVIGVWVALSLFLRAFHLHREGKREERGLKFEQEKYQRLREDVSLREDADR